MTLNNINSLFKCARLYLIINCRLYIAEQENSLKFCYEMLFAHVFGNIFYQILYGVNEFGNTKFFQLFINQVIVRPHRRNRIHI